MAQEGLKTSQMHQLTFQLTLLRYSDQDVILRYAIFRAVFITLTDFICLMSTNTWCGLPVVSTLSLSIYKKKWQKMIDLPPKSLFLLRRLATRKVSSFK